MQPAPRRLNVRPRRSTDVDAAQGTAESWRDHAANKDIKSISEHNERRDYHSDIRQETPSNSVRLRREQSHSTKINYL
jgi:hypothetical protein